MSLRKGVARAISLGFIAWLGVSTVEQLRFQRVQRYRRWDVLGLIPVWTFFAPNPATGDYYIVYRDELASGMRTLWVEAIVSPSQRSLHASIWNPDRRATKALFDISSGLALFVRDSPDSDAVQLTLPYLALLTFISNQARHLPERRCHTVYAAY